MNWTLSSIFFVLDAIEKTTASYAAAIGLFVLCSAILFSRFGKSFWSYAIAWTIYPLVFAFLALMLGRDVFDAISLMGMSLFVGGVALAFVSACFAWAKSKMFASVFIGFATTLIVVGVDAFLVEPYWLDVRHETVVSDKATEPVRIAVLSDIQTDKVGGFEEKILKTTLAEKPDMVLLPGDFIQTWMSEHKGQTKKLHDLMKRLNLTARLGVFATQGDSERPDWVTIFDGLPIKTFPESGTISAGRDIVVTGLTLFDSWKLGYRIPQTDKFHVIVGHRPDFMLKATEGDLLIAGHTHGGQVQLPFYGPLLCFSEAPRKWCAGCCVKRDDGSTCIISRGLGMERWNAPRLRFLCRPEIVVVDVVPAGSVSKATSTASSASSISR